MVITDSKCQIKYTDYGSNYLCNPFLNGGISGDVFKLPRPEAESLITG